MSTDYRALCAELIEAVLADDSRLDILDIAGRARAALAEPVGEQPAPPAAGEVGEVVMELRRFRSVSCHRAADLLSIAYATGPELWEPIAQLPRQRHPSPVPVSRRLPDASDPRQCRMPDGDCWWFDPHADGAWYMDTYQSCYTHWLPATALPLPAGEVQP